MDAGGEEPDVPAEGVISAPRQGYDDMRRVKLLTDEARVPPARLTIVDTGATITMTNELGQSRSVHPDGRTESIDVQGVATTVVTKRAGDRLVIEYRVEPGREVRYTYARAPDSSQMIVDVEFLEHGTGDKARLVYEPGAATETAPSSTQSPAGVIRAGQPAGR